MFRFKSLIAAAAASALVATPALAAGNSAQSLSVAHARAAAPPKAGEKIAEGSTATIVNIGILAALAAVVLLVVADDDGDDSDSN
ncbi:hypothetical protein [Sphingomonas rubra]|uniref:Uncharacterized protein n=1 Tax=Sphingomonas rubra TaxID=634430 RepID=A0A1I5U4P5_9SPHN|nr:hypothetical protein [Sphingomonas rubra]SFP90230.1 hypothetical protein SAMN04488241_110111 [Sphingomonas rubra]